MAQNPDISVGDALIWGLTKFTNYRDRSTRKEYWVYILVASSVWVFSQTLLVQNMVDENVGLFLNLIWIIGAAYILTCLPLAVRRLHDINKSGWWLFLLAVPFVGWLIGFVWFCTKGEPEANKWGPPASNSGSSSTTSDYIVGADSLIATTTQSSYTKTPSRIEPSKITPNNASLLRVPDAPFIVRSENLVVDQPDNMTEGSEAPLLLQGHNLAENQPDKLVEAFYEQAFLELEDGRKHIATWSKSFADSEGNLEKAKALYITRRVAGLTKEHADAEAVRAAEQKAIEGREANQRKAQQEADRKERLKSEREASERSVDISIQQYKADLERREKNNKAFKRYLEEQLRDNAKESEDKRKKRTLFGFFWS